MKKPNILFFMTDQHRHDAFGILNPHVKTPNLDKLIGKGVLFREAVCQAPMCVPSRYSMMTGFYPFQLGTRTNICSYQDLENLPVPSLAEYLKDAGYHTFASGKTHWYVGADSEYGIPQRSPNRYGYDRRAIAQERLEQDDKRPGFEFWENEDREAFDTWNDVEERTSVGKKGGEDIPGYMGDVYPLPLERTREGWYAEKFMGYLEDALADKGTPWFGHLSFDAPHAPLFPTKEFEDMYDIDDIPEQLEVPEDIFHHHGPTASSGQMIAHWKTMTSEERKWTILRYYALCSMVDHFFGKVITRLEEAGELENTFIIFTADHGDSLSDRGRFSKYSHYESAVRVPLFIAGPGVAEGVIDRRPAELTDVLPTILQVGGVAISPRLPGESLLDAPKRKGAFSEFHGYGYEGKQVSPIWMWRTKTHKLILTLPGDQTTLLTHQDEITGELYAIEKDPMELENLYDDPAHRDLREEMTIALLGRIMTVSARYPRVYTRARIQKGSNA